MGFELTCLFAVDREVLPLYERLVPGGSQWVVPTGGAGLPAGWVLPDPWQLQYATDGAVRVAERWIRPDAVDAWRRAAGVPGRPDPLDAFDGSELQVASLLSLVAPAGVAYLDDQTFGGVLLNEFAAVCVAGRLRAAYGVDFGSPGRDDARAFELRDGTYRLTDPAKVRPVTDCVTVLDGRFEGAFLFDGYLPRDAYSQTYSAPRPVETGPLCLSAPSIRGWASYFPILAELPTAAGRCTDEVGSITVQSGRVAPGATTCDSRQADSP